MTKLSSVASLDAATVPDAGSLRCNVLHVEFARGKGMFSACRSTSEINSMIQARHQIAADRRYPSVTVSGAGLREVWIEAWLGLVLDRWQPTRHGSDQPGGNMASKPNAQAWRQIVGPVP